MPLLRSIEKRPSPNDGFPFSIPVIASLDVLEFTAPLTFFAGENGSGKSTLLEAIAAAVGSITVGAESVQTDPTLADVRRLSDALKLVWSKRTRRGLFLRAEDFFGYARQMAQTRAELRRDLEEADREARGRSETARAYARSAYAGQLGDMQRRYGDGLDAQSHGESFLMLFQQRFTGEGLYLLDEPEAPLSPMRQLTLLTLLHEMLKQGAQFIIATHSPILMAYPGAAILNFDGPTIQPTEYESLEHVQVMQTFLADPQQYLRHLLRD